MQQRFNYLTRNMNIIVSMGYPLIDKSETKSRIDELRQWQKPHTLLYLVLSYLLDTVASSAPVFCFGFRGICCCCVVCGCRWCVSRVVGVCGCGEFVWFPQSNGFVEAAVKIVKWSVKKADDGYRALQLYRSTPLANGFSPAELLNGRAIRTSAPVISSKLNPKHRIGRQYLRKKAFGAMHKSRIMTDVTKHKSDVTKHKTWRSSTSATQYGLLTFNGRAQSCHWTPPLVPILSSPTDSPFAVIVSTCGCYSAHSQMGRMVKKT
uniref:Uncharacterized protein n=1 Tax=Strigamia maritima TaxID=126957 RepID=T1J9L0_STRMM